jgi:hypothetical protein
LGNLESGFAANIPGKIFSTALKEAEKRRAGMRTAKEQMVEVIEQQPDDSSYDEILRELAFARMIQRGLEDSRSGRIILNKDVALRIRAWQK